MFDLEYFESRKKALEDTFKSVGDEIRNAEGFIKQKQVNLSELRGAFAECEVNIEKLKEVKNDEVNSESAQENKI